MSFGNSSVKENYVHIKGGNRKERLMIKLFEKDNMFVIQANNVFKTKENIKERNLKFIFKDRTLLKPFLEETTDLFELLNDDNSRKTERITTSSGTKTNVLSNISDEINLFWLKDTALLDLVTEEEKELFLDFIQY